MEGSDEQSLLDHYYLVLEEYKEVLLDFFQSGSDEFVNTYEFRRVQQLELELSDLYWEALQRDNENLGAFLTRGGIPRC